MKIKNIEVIRKDIALTHPYTIAFKTISDVENGIIRITSEEGIVGLGAFNVSSDVVGETNVDVFSKMSDTRLEWLIGRDVREINQLCFEVQQKLSDSVGARIGLEIALYDLFSKKLELPLACFFGQKIQSMPTSITIGIKGVEETLIEAQEYVDQKFQILKVKLGVTVEEDVERLVKIREKYGEAIRIIIDVNQAYDTVETIRFYQAIQRLNIELIEQPMPAKDIPEMTQLPEDIRALIAADESLVDVSSAYELVKKNRGCGFFNIKLMKCGGLTQALQIAEVASRNNIGLMWGCNDESIISITAALHTAFSCPHTKFIDLDGSFDLEGDVVTGGFVLKNGVMSISDKPGLGVEEL